MKTVIVLSDTHGNVKLINSLYEIMSETDYIVHLGDCSKDMEKVKERFPEKFIGVDGNCDVGNTVGKSFKVENKTFFATHGHKFGVKNGLNSLCFFAQEKGFDIVLYGHTHVAFCEKAGNTLFVNPGTLEKRNANKSYAYLVVNKDDCVCKILPIKEIFLKKVLKNS